MRKILIYFGLIIYLFLTNSVASSVGIRQVGTTSSIILIIFFFITLSSKRILQIKEYFTNEISLIFLSIIIIIFQFILGNNVTNELVFSFIVPLIILFFIIFENKKFKKKIQLLIIFFFFLECTLAMYEKYNGFILFTSVSNEALETTHLEAKWLFRSNSLLGHPLENALVVSIILSFILCGEFKKTFKIFCLITGFIAFLCFNARGAILIWSGIGGFYLFQTVIDKSANILVRSFLLIVSIVSIVGIFFLMFKTDLGGRIVNEDKILDGSANTRLQVFAAFDFISTDDFIFGNLRNYLKVTKKLGAGGVENSYIVYILNYGVICASFIFLYLYRIIKRYIFLYTTSNQIILFISFIVLGSFNNGLADGLTWKVFFLCISVFVRNKNENLPKKVSENIIVKLGK